MTPNHTTTDFLDTLGRASSRQALLDCLDAELKTYGVGGFAYGFVPVRTSRGIEAGLHDFHFFHTYPAAWETAIGDDHPLTSDPTGPMILSGPRTVDWTAPLDVLDDLPPANRRRFEAALDLGMRFGMDLVLGEDHHGRRLSGAGLWFADRPDAEAFWADWSHHGAAISSVMYLFDAAVRGRKAPEMIGLSERERDALCYLANGHRSAEASWAMGISEKTFEKHVAHAKEKLNARTRDHAIAKALVMGLIEL